MRPQFIAIHPEAPPKPPLGAACNGCGVCCLAEPCPAGQLLTLRRRGACRLLAWDAPQRRYRCSLLSGSRRGGWVERAVTRWIAAGQGCDADATVEPA